MDYLSRRYDHLKSDIIRNERLLLREFGFIVHVEHPHKFVLNYLQMMGKQDMMQVCRSAPLAAHTCASETPERKQRWSRSENVLQPPAWMARIVIWRAVVFTERGFLHTPSAPSWSRFALSHGDANL